MMAQNTRHRASYRKVNQQQIAGNLRHKRPQTELILREVIVPEAPRFKADCVP
jgi:hypothetical protein